MLELKRDAAGSVEYFSFDYSTSRSKSITANQYQRTPASGYGSKLPQSIEVFYSGKWRRVYAICYSNCATLYFIYKGLRHVVGDADVYNLKGAN